MHETHLASHEQVLTHFLNKIKPRWTAELGCGYYTTPLLDQFSEFHKVYECRVEWLQKWRDEQDLRHTSFKLYDRIEPIAHQIANPTQYDTRFDLVVVGGKPADRGDFAQAVIDGGTRVVICLDWQDRFICGYNAVRSGGRYDFRAFENRVTHVQTGVWLRRSLECLEIAEHD